MVEFVKRDNINAPTKMKYVKSTILSLLIYFIPIMK